MRGENWIYIFPGVLGGGDGEMCCIGGIYWERREYIYIFYSAEWGCLTIKKDPMFLFVGRKGGGETMLIVQ